MPATRRRRLLLAAGLACPAWLGAATLAAPRRVIAPMTEGPFYPAAGWRARNAVNREDWDADLTRVRQGGQVLRSRGEVLGLQLRVIDGCEVEIWQCDVLRAYRHPSVTAEPGRYDPGFQGFGTARGGPDGEVAFRTIRPVPYPGRTPHIHVKLRHASFGEVTSQLFVDGDGGNARDFLWRQLDPGERDALALRLQPAAAGGLQWQAQHDLVLPA
ncbi:MAG: intradiol ring-cleavage dioxygenase [Rubrivivax sp.]